MRFQEIIGQKEVKSHLVNTVKEDRISHAQLFLGPEGSGALPLAIAYAQYLFCENKGESDACGECPSCKKVEKLNHPDLHFSFPVHLSKSVRTSDDLISEWRGMLDNQTYFGLNDWNGQLGGENKQGVIANDESINIVKKLVLKSFEGGYKVLIIWLPELMNGVAANKLLKIIEEPPNNTLFLLVAESQDKMLATILSRTQLVKIPRLGLDEVSEYLRTKEGLPPDSAQNLAHLSEGNVAKALTLKGNQEETSFNLENFIQWMRLCYQRNIVDTVDWVDGIASSGRETQKQFLQYSLNMFRQCIVGHYSNGNLVVLTPEQDGFLKKFAPFINSKNIVALTENFNEAHYHLERNANPKITFLDLSLKVFALLKRK